MPDTLEIRYVLIIASRLLEMFGFSLVLLMVFKNVAIKFILTVVTITLITMTTAVFSFLTGKVPISVSFSIDLMGAFLVTGITFYAFLHKKRDRLKAPPSPKDKRCPVCTAFVKDSDSYVVAREGSDLLYFDSREHFEKFIKEFEEYKSIRKLSVSEPEEFYDKEIGKWLKVTKP